MLGFRFARRLEVNGFSTVVVNDQNGYTYLTVGFQNYSALEPLVGIWLTGVIPDRLAAGRQRVYPS